MHKLLVAVLLPVAGVLFGTAQTEQARRPTLPSEPYAYADAHYQLPVHFTGGLRGPLRGARPADNTPADNPITDEGATLGRVLFYDVRLSAGNTVSCGTCHRQEFGFSDPERLSVGIHGQTTDRHSMALANARYYPSGRFFWDERAATLEEQVLEPVLRTRGGEPRRLGLGEADIDALVAFLETLTDEAFLMDPRFSDPFRD
jgi:cytochrome c peroxidase